MQTADTLSLRPTGQIRNGFAYPPHWRFCAPQIRGGQTRHRVAFENGNGFRFAETVLSIHARPRWFWEDGTGAGVEVERRPDAVTVQEACIHTRPCR